MVTEPAFHTAALVVVGAAALAAILVAALEAVNIEIAHIGADGLKIFNQLAIG
jgi:hypothetical protein